MEKLYSLEEAAEYLGFTPKSLYNMKYEGKGPKAIKLGGKNVYPESHIIAYVEEAKKKNPIPVTYTEAIDNESRELIADIQDSLAQIEDRLDRLDAFIAEQEDKK